MTEDILLTINTQIKDIKMCVDNIIENQLTNVMYNQIIIMAIRLTKLNISTTQDNKQNKCPAILRGISSTLTHFLQVQRREIAFTNVFMTIARLKFHFIK